MKCYIDGKWVGGTSTIDEVVFGEPGEGDRHRWDCRRDVLYPLRRAVGDD